MLGKGSTHEAGSISSELLMCVGVCSICYCLEPIDVLALAGLCLIVVVTPSVKISLPNREGPTLIYKAYRRDAYYVL